jgi:NitT/TauT family transport system substrate-binding protein
LWVCRRSRSRFIKYTERWEQRVKATVTRTLAVVLVGLVALALGACGGQGAKLKDVTLVIPVAEMGVPYADFIIADQVGYFAEEGLNVKIELQSGVTDGLKAVYAGKAQFAFAAPDVVMTSWTKDLPSVVVFGSVQKYQFGFATPADSGITDVKGLKGKSIGLAGAGTDTIAIPILEAAGLTQKDVDMQVLPFASRAATLDQKKIDSVLTWDTEVAEWRSKGMKVNFIPGGDLLPYMGNGLTTSEQVIKDNPKLVEGFLRATAKAMVFAQANPDVTMQIIKKKYPEAVKDDAGARAVLDAAIAREHSKFTDQNGLGWLRADAWDQQQQGMLKLKLIDKTTPVDKIISNQFITAANNFDHAKVQKQAQDYKVS